MKNNRNLVLLSVYVQYMDSFKWNNVLVSIFQNPQPVIQVSVLSTGESNIERQS